MKWFISCLLLGLGWTYAATAQESAQKVTVGAYVNDIHTVDLAQHAYAVDLYVWFRWTDPTYNPRDSVEFMNMFDADNHTHEWGYGGEPQPQPDGSRYMFVRHQGLFSSKFPLKAYPFDRQTLRIALEDSELGSNDLQFVSDTDGAKMNPRTTLPGYDIGEARLAIENKPYPTTFGDLANPDATAYSRVEIHVPVIRPWGSGAFKVIAPIFIIIITAAFALLLDPEHVEARIGLAITALLTLVALQFTLLSGLPEVSYLTLLDQVFLASYGYILLVVALVVRATRVDQRGSIVGTEKARSGWVGSLVLTTMYFASVATIIWYNIAQQPAQQG